MTAAVHMNTRLKLRVITPERVLLDEEAVEQVVATAVDGQLSVLPEHEPLVTSLAIDLVRYRIGGEDRSAVVMGGVLEVSRGNTVTILSDLAELDIEVDEARARKRKERAEAEKMQKVDKLDVYLAEMSISKAIARLKAAELARDRKARARQYRL